MAIFKLKQDKLVEKYYLPDMGQWISIKKGMKIDSESDIGQELILHHAELVSYEEFDIELLNKLDGLSSTAAEIDAAVAGSGGSIALGWKDNIQPFSSAKGKGTNEPTWEDIGNGHYLMLFGTGDELFVAFHVDHDYALGTGAYPHVHFISDSVESAGATVVWDFHYSIAKGHSQGQSLTGARTHIFLTYVYTGNEVAGEHIVVECNDIDAIDLIEPDVVVLAGVTLTSSSTDGNVYGIMSDLHYQTDRESTINKAPDFYV